MFAYITEETRKRDLAVGCMNYVYTAQRRCLVGNGLDANGGGYVPLTFLIITRGKRMLIYEFLRILKRTNRAELGKKQPLKINMAAEDVLYMGNYPSDWLKLINEIKRIVGDEITPEQLTRCILRIADGFSRMDIESIDHELWNDPQPVGHMRAVYSAINGYIKKAALIDRWCDADTDRHLMGIGTCVDQACK